VTTAARRRSLHGRPRQRDQPRTTTTPASTLLSGTLSFAANETSKTITLDVTDDLVPEDTENFTVELSGASNATISRAVATGTILDNDLPTLSIADATATEGDPGGRPPRSASRSPGRATTAARRRSTYSVAPAARPTPDDYNGSIDALSGTLTFAANETSKTITLDVTDDLLP
jgi:FlaG/FlaF family flagellin (archaellin)